MQSVITYAYLAAAVLFVVALKSMASPRTARRGNLIGALGMLIAIVATLVSRDPAGLKTFVQGHGWMMIIAGGVAGSLIGALLALTVKMTAMPQMVAMFNGLGGLASGLVVFAEIWRRPDVFFTNPLLHAEATTLAVTVGISTLIGWVTFTGSVVAFAKLQELVISG